MGTDNTISGLIFMTFGVVLVIAMTLYWWFMRKHSNRHPMDHQRERNIDEIRRGVPPEQE